jgi:hypothetical protein
MEEKNLQTEKMAMLLLLEEYLKNDEKEKAAILAQKIEELNEKLEEDGKKK